MNDALQAQLVSEGAKLLAETLRGLIAARTGRAPQTIPPAEVRHLLSAIQIEPAWAIAAEGEAEGAAQLAETDSNASEEGD